MKEKGFVDKARQALGLDKPVDEDKLIEAAAERVKAYLIIKGACVASEISEDEAKAIALACIEGTLSDARD